MSDNIIWHTDFRAKRERDHVEFLIALSQAMATDIVDLGIPTSNQNAETKTFIEWRARKYPELADFVPMSIEERVRRSIYHSAGLPYPKDRA